MMQRLKGLINLKQTRNGFLSYQRNFSALPNYAPNDDSQDQVAQLKRLYESWEENPDIGFCLNEVKFEECKTYFQKLYKFVYLQATYLKPHVAILDGFSMGSGAGIAVAGMFRVATDKTVFAHPEAQISFHPDAGEYLALTGDKLNGVEMIACGLASHYALHERLDLVEERLGKLITDEATVIETSLAQYGDLVYPDKTSILYKFETFDKCFSHDTVEEIVDALENEKASTYDEWCERAISKIKEAAPLSLKVTLQSIREGRFQSLDQCLAREYCISLTGISKRVSNDFCEWDPSRLGEVSKDMVDSYFSRLRELEDLELPTTLQGVLDANDWGHLQTGMMRVLEDTGDLLPFSFALLAWSIIAAGAGI